jgi:16S rRNA (guanine966-N2)-methyltransferase
MSKRAQQSRSRKPAAPYGGRPPGQIRVIAGRWRGRRLPVADADGLRPTGDRVRETLFNWLAPRIEGARCLDLFAGTGALGIEALSRGATEAWFIERDAAVAAQLTVSLMRLGAEQSHVVSMDAHRFLARPAQPFDVVFLDPPFGGPDLGDLCRLLGAGWLREGALVYLEMSRALQMPALLPSWELLREKTAGQVRFGLVRYSPGT